MRNPIRLLALVSAALALPAIPASAQSAGAGTPRPAHERLAVFEGTWGNPDQAGADGFVEVCAWLAGGRRHMICKPRWNTPYGPREHRTIYSYRGRDSTYIVTALLATGQVWTYHGRPDGNRWTFDLQSDRPNNPQRLRMLLTVVGDTIRFVEESSENEGPWVTTEDYRHVRLSRGP